MHDTKQNIECLDFLEGETEVLLDERHRAIKQIEAHLPAISKMALVAKNLVVEDMDNCKRALDFTSDVRTTYKAIEEYRKVSIEPMRKMVLAINECAKALQEQLNQVEFDIKIKIASFQQKEQERTKAAEEAVKKLSESLGIEITVPNSSNTVKSVKASAYFKENYAFEIADPSSIPDEYWIVDEKLIQKHIDLGKREIPGVVITKEKKFVVRKK